MVTGRQVDEPVFTLVEAAGWLERRFGRRPNVATVWRWAIKGVRGVRLHTIALGRFRFTTEQALEQFIAATSVARDTCAATAPATSSTAGDGDAGFTRSEVAAAQQRREAAKEKAKEFLRQQLGSSRTRSAKRA